jgi:hypothetical protein
MSQATIVRKQLPQNVPAHVMSRLMGTSADSRAPWDTWTAADPLAGCSDELRAEIAEYSQKHHGKTSLKNVELLCEQKEKSTEFVKDYRWYKQDELRDSPERVGRIMHCLEFLDLLNKIRPAYLSANIRKGLSGLAVYHPTEIDGKEVEWQYVCGVQVGYMHEYSSMHFDSHGLPLNEKWRGWRTVLLRLIQLGHITEEQALKVFGEPTEAGARRYKEQLYYWRNRKEDTNRKW